MSFLIASTNLPFSYVSVHGINKEPPTNRNIVGQQMAPALPWIPKWESRLALERMPWPKRYPEFTVSCNFLMDELKFNDHVNNVSGINWVKYTERLT